MKTKITALIVVIFMSVSAFAQQGGMPCQNPQEPKILNVIPDLTQEQKDKIGEYQTQMLKTTTPLKAEMKQKKAELDVLMTKDTDIKAKEKVVNEMQDIRTKMQMARITYHDNVRAILNEKQKLAFDNWYLNRGPKNQRPMGPRPKGKAPMGPGPRGHNPNCPKTTPNK